MAKYDFATLIQAGQGARVHLLLRILGVVNLLPPTPFSSYCLARFDIYFTR